MKTEITYSKDYDLLFDLVMGGNVIPAFVDYNYAKKFVCRDICKVTYNEMIGIKFFGLCIDYNTLEEIANKTDFIKHCKYLNLEFITNIRK